jgi:hypothetical protein
MRVRLDLLIAFRSGRHRAGGREERGTSMAVADRTGSEAIVLLREQLRLAHAALDQAVAGVRREEAHWLPPGDAAPIGATYAQAVIVEDVITHVTLQGGIPLFASSWDGRVGVSDCMPLPGPLWDAFTWPDYSYAAWSRMTRVSLRRVRRYAQAVYAATNAWLEALPPDGLDRPVDLAALGHGDVPARWVVSRVLIGQADAARGAIACLRQLASG